MRRFVNILVAAVALMGCVACNTDNTDAAVDSVSFYAAVDAQQSRLALEQDGQQWNSVWQGGEQLAVTADEQTYFVFKNTTEEPTKFTCTTEGVGALLNGKVSIYNAAAQSVVNSSLGANGVCLYANASLAEGKVTLAATSALLCFSSEYYITFEGADMFGDGKVKSSEITVAAGNNVLVPVNAGSATLSYYIAGSKCKSMELDVQAGKVYSLGALEPGGQTPTPDPSEGAVVYFVPNADWKADNAWFAAYFWNGADSANAQLTDADADGVYECTVPAGMTDMLFCRMNPAYAEFGWNSETETDRVWNQTADTTVGTSPYNYYYITGWTTGEWHEAGYVVPEAPAVTGNAIYFVPNADWKNDGAWFAAYFWNGTESGSVKLADSDADGIYEGAVPSNMTDMLFCRMNPAYTEFGWNSDTETDRVWNQTLDTTVGTAPYNYFYITGWDSGEWHEAGYVVPENPVTPPSTAGNFALAGTFNGWGDLVMTNNNGIHSAKGVAMEAYGEFKVKDAASWEVNFGAADVSYMNANKHIVVAQGGGNISIVEAGTYDVYFDEANLKLYVVTAGADYTTAPLQTVNGKEPVQEEPEVTENVVYLKPNSNWVQSDARFAAYFWNNSSNIWVSAVDKDADGIYEIYIPTGYGTNIIFCRMNPSTTANNWTNKWDQTIDLTIPTDGKNLFTVKDGDWNNAGGTWSVK